jgi:hypothetical protein
MGKYIVVFIGVDVDDPLDERTFDSKHDAKVYKHEHPQGKHATVIKDTGTYSE